MAQLGARLDGIEEVEGSNPFGSTNVFKCDVSVPCPVEDLCRNLCRTVAGKYIEYFALCLNRSPRSVLVVSACTLSHGQVQNAQPGKHGTA